MMTHVCDIDVHIRRVSTGEVRVYRSPALDVPEEPGVPFLYIWSEGNFACDCNRCDFWHTAGRDKPDDDVWIDAPCGDTLYRIDKIVRCDTGEMIYGPEADEE